MLSKETLVIWILLQKMTLTIHLKEEEQKCVEVRVGTQRKKTMKYFFLIEVTLKLQYIEVCKIIQVSFAIIGFTSFPSSNPLQYV